MGQADDYTRKMTNTIADRIQADIDALKQKIVFMNQELKGLEKLLEQANADPGLTERLLEYATPATPARGTRVSPNAGHKRVPHPCPFIDKNKKMCGKPSSNSRASFHCTEHEPVSEADKVRAAKLYEDWKEKHEKEWKASKEYQEAAAKLKS